MTIYSDQSLTSIGSIRGLDWIGWHDCDPVFLIDNHCSTLDAVYFKLWLLWTFDCPGFATIKSRH